MRTPSPARLFAYRALSAVRQGKSINDALRTVPEPPLSAVDRALATQIVYGVLRNQRYLDAWMRPFIRGKMQPEIIEILRMGFFQMGFLDRVPSYAIVDDAVEQAKQINPKTAGLVNAILRKGQREGIGSMTLGEQYSVPDWLVTRWKQQFGPRLEEVLVQNNRIPPLTLRVNLRQTSREHVLALLEEHGIHAEPSPYLPEAIRVTGAMWLEDFPSFQEGLLTVQDESGMLVTWVADPKPGDRVLDLAVGVGGKTTHMLEKADVSITAVDLSADRLDKLAENLSRLQLTGQVAVIKEDSRRAVERFAGQFDTVLLDAPCSGLGVLRRRVDARWKKLESQLREHQKLQGELLDAAVVAVRAGGTIIYSTCSVEPEETFAVIRSARTRHPGLTVQSLKPYLPDPTLEDFLFDKMLRLAPGDLGMDGFFIARLQWEGDKQL